MPSVEEQTMDTTRLSTNDECNQPKKHFPSFWRVLKHPSPNSIPPELPSDPLEALTQPQRATYDYLLNTLDSPEFQLPKSSSSSSRNNTNDNSENSLKLTESEKCYCSRECLLRVCRATGWDSNRALKRLIDTLIWRRDFKVDQINYREVWEAAGPGVEFTIGYDNKQRPLLYMFPSKQSSKLPSTHQIKLLVWYLERTIDLMPPGVETLTLMIDFSSPDEKVSNSPPAPISTAKEVLKILQTYYCERLGQAICVNVPWVFWGFFKILKPFLDSKTTQKILFDPVVTDHVPAEQLVKEGFQGDLDFQYDHETYFPLLAELTAHRRRKMLGRYKRLAKGKVGMSEYELRSSSRQSKTRREMSIGSETTATSAQVTHPSSPTILGQPSGSKVPQVCSRPSSAITFHSSTKPTSSFTTQMNASSTHPPNRSPGDPLSGRDHIIVASRPFSMNSFSSPSPPSSKSEGNKTLSKKATKEHHKLCNNSTENNNNTKLDSNHQIQTDSQSPPSSSALTTSPCHSIGKKNLHHQSNNADFDYHNLIDLSRDEHGRVQTDSMSFSRRINAIFA